MRRITTTFANKVGNKAVEKKEKNVFNTVYKTLAKVYGKDKVDLEAIMSVIAGLKEKEYIHGNIGELGLFVLQREGIKNYVKQFKYSTNVLDNLEKKFREHIRKSVVVHKPRKIVLIRDVYYDF